MKRTLLVLIMVLVFGSAVVSSGSYACEGDEKGMMGGMDSEGGMMSKGSMHGMMMKGMMGASLVATSDAGVVVLKGHTLTKYDKQLNVVRTADISDGSMMMGKGKKGKGCCMMGMGKKKTDNAEATAVPAPVAAEDAEHKAHH